MQVPSRERVAAVEVAGERIVVSIGAWRLVRSHEPPQGAAFGRGGERSTIERCEQRICGCVLDPLRLPFAVCGANELGRLVEVAGRPRGTR